MKVKLGTFTKVIVRASLLLLLVIALADLSQAQDRSPRETDVQIIGRPERPRNYELLVVATPQGEATGMVRGGIVGASNPRTWDNPRSDGAIVFTSRTALVEFQNFHGNGGFVDFAPAGYGKITVMDKGEVIAKLDISDDGLVLLGDSQSAQVTDLEGQLVTAGAFAPVRASSADFKIYGATRRLTVPAETSGLTFRLEPEMGKELALDIIQISDADPMPDAGIVMRMQISEAMTPLEVAQSCSSIRRIPQRTPAQLARLDPYLRLFFNRMFFFPERNAGGYSSLWFLPTSIQLAELALAKNDDAAQVVAFGLSMNAAGARADLIGFLYSPLGCHAGSFPIKNFLVNGLPVTITPNSTVQDLVSLYRAGWSNPAVREFAGSTLRQMQANHPAN